MPLGAEANTQILRGAVAAEKGGSGFFNVVVDPDGVVRRVPLALPYGRDPDGQLGLLRLDRRTDVAALLPPEDRGNGAELRRRGSRQLEFGSNVTVRPKTGRRG